LFAGDKTITVVVQTIDRYVEQQQSVLIAAARLPYTRKIRWLTQAQMSLHSGFPVHLLDMIRRNRQFMPTMTPPGLQYPPSILGLHTLAESMHTFTPPNFGLPRPFS
jgi:hypothetical protein